MKKIMEKTSGGLNYIEVLGSENPAYTFLFLHGYAADAKNVMGINQIKPAERWIFPDALKDSDGAQSWFEFKKINFPSDLQNQEFHQEIQEQIQKGQTRILNFIKSLNLNPEELILGGFSQGAILSSALALTAFKPKALIICSGGGAFFKSPKDSANKKSKPKKFFQSHGTQDSIVPFASGEALYQNLKTSGWKGSFYKFDGGHEIPLEILNRLKAYLNQEL